jgi:hypothetical protein
MAPTSPRHPNELDVRHVGPMMIGCAPVACDVCGERTATRLCSPGGWNVCERPLCLGVVRQAAIPVAVPI